MDGQVEVTWRTLRTISHSLMLHARVLEACIHFVLMYMTDNILLVPPIKNLINKDGKPTTPFKLQIGTKPSVSQLHALFCQYVVQKDIAQVDKKVLNTCHQAQKGFRGIFVGITRHQKGYLVYVPSTRKIISSFYVVFDEKIILR